MIAMNTAITAMKANQSKLDVISNNISNSSTTSFKSSTVNFSDTLYQVSESATSATTSTGGTNAKEVGLGTEVSSVNKLMTQGNMESTGRSLDVAIDGDGYLVIAKGDTTSTITVDTTANTITGSTTDATYFTRDGNLALDQNGYLVTSDGYRVMGYGVSGESYTDNTDGTANITAAVSSDSSSLAYTTGTLQALTIPSSITPSGGSTAEAVQSFAIGSDGVITVTTSSGKYAIGQLAMASFSNPAGLQDDGGNLQEESSNSGSAIIRTAASVAKGTTGYNAGAFGSVKSGYLEASNVDLTTEFASMITTSKAFQAASKMITNESDLLDTVIGLVR